MNKLLLVLLTMCTVGFSSSCQSSVDAPMEIAGFVLGENIERYKDRIDMSSVIPVQHSEYLSEVDIKPVEGFRSGYIGFGNCSAPGRIVRFKMKYAYSDKEFYDKIFELFKKRYGEPDEWKGNAFHTFVAWKWSLRDAHNNAVSMILQHGMEEDEEHTTGNTLKLTNWTYVDEEHKCYDEKHPETAEKVDLNVKSRSQLKFPEDYERLVPK